MERLRSQVLRPGSLGGGQLPARGGLHRAQPVGLAQAAQHDVLGSFERGRCDPGIGADEDSALREGVQEAGQVHKFGVHLVDQHDRADVTTELEQSALVGPVPGSVVHGGEQVVQQFAVPPVPVAGQSDDAVRCDVGAVCRDPVQKGGTAAARGAEEPYAPASGEGLHHGRPFRLAKERPRLRGPARGRRRLFRLGALAGLLLRSRREAGHLSGAGGGDGQQQRTRGHRGQVRGVVLPGSSV